MNRDVSLQKLRARDTPWDIAVIGGGATGVGVAVDAAARGYAICLLEQSDFGKGTSSRSTKLIHGGVRYLQRGNVPLVMAALKERGILRQNAPHLVRDLAFVVPSYRWWQSPFYGIGLKVYDLLALRYGFGRSHRLSRQAVLEHIPTLEEAGLRGGVIYYDGQFDDARLLINLAQTAEEQGAVLVNYVPVTALTRDHEGFVNGLVARDSESGAELTIRARCVVNATGPFSDAIRRLDDPAAAPLIAPSQGVHLVLDGSFLPGDAAIMVPRTRDARVLFAIPWHGRVLIGTTDTPVPAVDLDPVATDAEIAFLLENAGRYLAKPPTRADIRSVFAGIRPLVRSGRARRTAALARDHSIQVSRSGLVTIAGGKWTTYRHMAEDCVDHAATLARLDDRPCVTRTLRIHGYHEDAGTFGDLRDYGADAVGLGEVITANPELGRRLDARLPITAVQVVWAARHEMARTVDDVLSRRTRALFLDATAAMEMAGSVAELLAAELGRDETWQRTQVAEFTALAKGYLPT